MKFVGAWISSQLFFFFFFFPDGFKVYCLFGSISGFCEEFLRPLGYSGITHTQDQPIKTSCVFDQWIFEDFHHHHDFLFFYFLLLFFFEAQGTAIHLWDFFSPFFFSELFSCFYLRLPGTVELFTRQALSFFCQLRTNPFGQLCLVTSDHPALFSSSLRFLSFLIIFFKLLLLPSVHLDSRI